MGMCKWKYLVKGICARFGNARAMLADSCRPRRLARTKNLRRICVPSMAALFAVRPMIGPPSRPGPAACGPPILESMPPACAVVAVPAAARAGNFETGSVGRIVVLGLGCVPTALLPVVPSVDRTWFEGLGVRPRASALRRRSQSISIAARELTDSSLCFNSAMAWRSSRHRISAFRHTSPRAHWGRPAVGHAPHRRY